MPGTSSPPPAAPGGETTDEVARRKVHHVSGWKVATLWLLGLLLRAWGRTLRVREEGTPGRILVQGDAPVVMIFWHNRLFFTPRLRRILRPKRPVVALVSASRDGAVFAKFMSFVGINAVRGSSSRFGREAAHGLIAALQSGRHVAVTPDGPRGPMYDMKPGALLAARRVGAPLLLIGVECRSCWTLRSWDCFRIPWPFSRVIVRFERIEPAQFTPGDAMLATLRARLLTLNGDRETKTG